MEKSLLSSQYQNSAAAAARTGRRTGRKNEEKVAEFGIIAKYDCPHKNGGNICTPMGARGEKLKRTNSV